jgi:histidine triad (HIT) family protein
MSDCLFCRIVAGEIPSKKVFENERLLAFEDINPQAPTHILLVPKKHFKDLFDAAQDPALLAEMVAQSASIARDRGLTAYRFVSNTGSEAGQAVFHLHFHILAGRRMGWPPG